LQWVGCLAGVERVEGVGGVAGLIPSK
jgi:hypothetical protein